jgi:sugar phosphate isomerase/epimerase
LSDPADRVDRRAALAAGLIELAEHALSLGTNLRICVENMPPGVHPGSRMADLAELLRELNHPRLALALDTGHANMTAGAAEETLAAGPLLATTHVHDNNGRQDAHEPPGHGTIDWPGWGRALDAIGYTGPIMLECIRHLRKHPAAYQPEVLRGIARIVKD